MKQSKELNGELKTANKKHKQDHDGSDHRLLQSGANHLKQVEKKAMRTEQKTYNICLII